jgi:hypothetical protein
MMRLATMRILIHAFLSINVFYLAMPVNNERSNESASNEKGCKDFSKKGSMPSFSNESPSKPFEDFFPEQPLKEITLIPKTSLQEQLSVLSINKGLAKINFQGFAFEQNDIKLFTRFLQNWKDLEAISFRGCCFPMFFCVKEVLYDEDWVSEISIANAFVSTKINDLEFDNGCKLLDQECFKKMQKKIRSFKYHDYHGEFSLDEFFDDYGMEFPHLEFLGFYGYISKDYCNAKVIYESSIQLGEKAEFVLKRTKRTLELDIPTLCIAHQLNSH